MPLRNPFFLEDVQVSETGTVSKICGIVIAARVFGAYVSKDVLVITNSLAVVTGIKFSIHKISVTFCRKCNGNMSTINGSKWGNQMTAPNALL